MKFQKEPSRFLAILRLAVALALIPAASQGKTRSLSLDSGYLTEANSNRAFSNMGMEWVDLQSFAFDKLHFTESPLGNAVTLLAGTALSYPLTVDAFMLPYHEFGHFSRVYAVGLDPQYDPAAGNFMQFFLNRFSNIFESASIQFGHTDRRFIPADDTRYVEPGPFAFTPSSVDLLTPEWGALFHAAGTNNETRFASDLADRLFDGSGHVYEWLPYSVGTLSVVHYNLVNDDPNQSDLNSLSRSYGRRGLAISVADMERANLIALAGSAATWAYAKGIWNFIARGESRVEAFSVKGVYLPMLSSYMGSQGISYRAASAYRLNEKTLFPFAVEFIGQGDSGQEYTLGWRQLDFLLPGLAPSLSATMGRGLNLNADLSYDATRFTRLTIGVERYDVDSFYGERNIHSVEKGRSATQGWARVSLLY